MFKKITTISLAVATITCGGQAMAENYVGGNISAVKVDFSIPENAKLMTVYGRLGTEFSENFSGEVRLGTGIDDDTIYGSGVDVELTHFYGAYVRGGISVNDTLFPYVIVGATHLELEIDGMKDSGGDASFGVGADISLNPDIAINLEYMNYYDKDDVSIDGFSLGFTYRFY